MAVDALGRGDQTVLLRKGGIREPRWSTRADAFYLFPTTFHAAPELLKPEAQALLGPAADDDAESAQQQLEIRSFAQVTGQWATADGPGLLEALDAFHVWTAEFGRTRLAPEAGRAVTALELRVFNLPEGIRFPALDEYVGCFSWVNVERCSAADARNGRPSHAQKLVDAARPALSEGEWRESQARLRRRLEGAGAEPLPLPAPGERAR